MVRFVDDTGAPSLWILLPLKLGLQVWYCPKGPVVWPSVAVWQDLIKQLQSVRRAAVLRIEPPRLTSETELINPILVFKKHADVSPAHTLLTNCSTDLAALEKSFHEKTRYNIRVAERHGVVVEKLSSAQAVAARDELLKLYSLTGERHGIKQMPVRDLAALFSLAEIWVARWHDRVVATSIQVGFGKIMTYLHGASLYEQRALMAPYALHWAVLQDAARRGFQQYDWWGIAPENAPEHKLAGVTRFKLGFGGQSVVAAGTFEAILPGVSGKFYRVLNRLRTAAKLPKSNK